MSTSQKYGFGHRLFCEAGLSNPAVPNNSRCLFLGSNDALVIPQGTVHAKCAAPLGSPFYRLPRELGVNSFLRDDKGVARRAKLNLSLVADSQKSKCKVLDAEPFYQNEV